MTKNKKENTAVTPLSALIPMMHPSPLHPDDPITANNVHPDEITRWLDEGWQREEPGKQGE